MVVPLVANQTHAEIARWHLAAAANAVILKDKGSPEEHLKKAELAFPNIDALKDTWLFRIKQAFVKSPEQVVPILEQAIAASPDNVTLVDFAALRLWKIDLHEQIKAYELIRTAGGKLTAQQLNSIAYARSVVVLDLDQALADIDKALANNPNELSYRDTRAWVLYHMERLEEAYVDSNFAVERFETAMRGDPISRALGTMLNYLSDAQEPTSEVPEVLTRAQAGEGLWGAGALFYHRAKILEGLGRHEEAEKDWQWLTANHLPHDDSLF